MICTLWIQRSNLYEYWESSSRKFWLETQSQQGRNLWLVKKNKEREDAIEIPTLADGSNEEDSSSEDS